MLTTRSMYRSRALNPSPFGHTYQALCRGFLLNRTESTAASKPPSDKAKGSLFLDSVFPVTLGRWDLRYYLALLREEHVLNKLRDMFKDVKLHGFEICNLEPRLKDGGVFLNFRYNSSESATAADDTLVPEAHVSAAQKPDPALAEIKQELLTIVQEKGGLPSWIEEIRKGGAIWRVRGKPWKEDMRRYASPILRVSFEGPDVGEEQIWELLRPYGRIRDVKLPTPVPAGVHRSALVTFERTHAAAIAHNCIHGAFIPSLTDATKFTRLNTGYERPIKPHLIRDWLASHPKIVFPVVVFLLGTLTYTVFDPIRAFMVQAKTMGWFDYRTLAVTKWIRRNALDRLAEKFEGPGSGESDRTADSVVWEDRKGAKTTINNYLTDYPTTITFVHGPAGSGKSRLLRSVLENSDRPTVIVNCSDIYAGASDAAKVKSLAEQTGYWPIFSFLNSVNNLIDLASVGLIGQKAGLASSLEDQVTQVLDVVAHGLRRATASRRSEADRRIERAEADEEKIIEDAKRRERIRRGTWHDGRIDCVSGNGVMSELGLGIESWDQMDEDPQKIEHDADAELLAKPELNEKVRQEREYRNAQDVGALPVVVIKNFDASGSKAGKEHISAALADWAADLVNGNVAHVIVLSDNRENAKPLARALPTKPLNAVALADADTASSLTYINQKLREASMDYTITPEEQTLVERVGGRASDLETIVHKVQAGQSLSDAVEDIIQRGVAELRKNAFGDDLEDAKALPWTRQQAWTVMKLLAQKDKVPYYKVLLDFPFKGDETGLRAMEHAELISITTVNGRPSSIQPGKPIYRYVFQRLLADRVFQATQDIALNEQLVSGAESTIKSAETELATLKEISREGQTSGRMAYLFKKMTAANEKILELEKATASLKQVLGEKEEIVEDEGNKRRWWVFG